MLDSFTIFCFTSTFMIPFDSLCFTFFDNFVLLAMDDCRKLPIKQRLFVLVRAEDNAVGI